MKLKCLGLLGSLAVLSLLTGKVSAGFISSREQLRTILGSNETFEDFETLDVPRGGQSFHRGTLNSTTIFNGSGPGLVQPGVTYSAGPSLYWNGDDYYGLSTQTLHLEESSGWPGGVPEIIYTAPINAFGFDMQGYRGYRLSGKVSVYDRSNSLVSSTAVNGGFFGWEHPDGIGRVVVSTGGDGYIMIDNHGYGLTVAATPEPATCTLLAVGMLSLVGYASLGTCRASRWHCVSMTTGRGGVGARGKGEGRTRAKIENDDTRPQCPTLHPLPPDPVARSPLLSCRGGEHRPGL